MGSDHIDRSRARQPAKPEPGPPPRQQIAEQDADDQAGHEQRQKQPKIADQPLQDRAEGSYGTDEGADGADAGRHAQLLTVILQQRPRHQRIDAEAAAARDAFEAEFAALVPLPPGKRYGFGYRFGKLSVAILDGEPAKTKAPAPAPRSLADLLGIRSI